MPTRMRRRITTRESSLLLREGDQEVKVTFEVTPPRVGRYVYEISVPHAPGEAVTTNRRMGERSLFGAPRRDTHGAYPALESPVRLRGCASLTRRAPSPHAACA